MSTTTVDPSPDEARRDTVRGLRDLADYIEQRGIDVRHAIAAVAGPLYGNREQMTEYLTHTAEQLGEYEMKVNDWECSIRRTFSGGVELFASAKRETVCTPVIVDDSVQWEAPDLKPGRRVEAESLVPRS